MTTADDTITIPRPKPDQAVIVICDEDGAFAWIKGSRSTLTSPEFLAQAEPLLIDAQQRLREKHGRPLDPHWQATGLAAVPVKPSPERT